VAKYPRLVELISGTTDQLIWMSRLSKPKATNFKSVYSELIKSVLHTWEGHKWHTPHTVHTSKTHFSSCCCFTASEVTGLNVFAID